MTARAVILVLLASMTVFAAPDFVWDEGNPAPAVKNITLAHGLRVMWWNVEDGTVNRSFSTSKPLDENIQTLLKSDIRPDILIFGEFSVRSFSSETLAALKNVFQFRQFQPYNKDIPDEGLMVFSTRSFETEPVIFLDWTPPALTSEHDRAEYRKKWVTGRDSFTRPFLELKINTSHGPKTLIPVHLLDPWREIRKNKGTFFTVKQVLYGTDNPLWYQILNYENSIEERFGLNFGSRPFLTFGDFNTPRGLLVETQGYRSLSRRLTDVVPGHPTTFPAKSAAERKTFPQLEIDHGFTNGQWNVSAAEVLPLRGSDHYALYFVLED